MKVKILEKEVKDEIAEGHRMRIKLQIKRKLDDIHNEEVSLRIASAKLKRMKSDYETFLKQNVEDVGEDDIPRKRQGGGVIADPSWMEDYAIRLQSGVPFEK